MRTAPDASGPGRRVNAFDPRPASERVVDVLLRKLHGQSWTSEIPFSVQSDVVAAAPLADLGASRIALVTEAGVVPRGNPDQLESRKATGWRKYSLRGRDLSSDRYESVHSGFNVRWVNEDPNRVLPVDVLRDSEREGRIGSLHDEYYVTVGVGTAVHDARRFGQEIARALTRAMVDAAILTTT